MNDHFSIKGKTPEEIQFHIDYLEQREQLNQEKWRMMDIYMKRIMLQFDNARYKADRELYYSEKGSRMLRFAIFRKFCESIEAVMAIRRKHEKGCSYCSEYSLKHTPTPTSHA